MQHHISVVALSFLCVSMSSVAAVEADYAKMIGFLEDIAATQATILQDISHIKEKLKREEADNMWLFPQVVRSFCFWSFVSLVVAIALSNLLIKVQIVEFVAVPSFMKGLRNHGKKFIIRSLKEPFVLWAFEKINELREDDFLLVAGIFFQNLIGGGFSPGNLFTLVSTITFNIVSHVKSSGEDAILRISYNYWEAHALTWDTLFEEMERASEDSDEVKQKKYKNGFYKKCRVMLESQYKTLDLVQAANPETDFSASTITEGQRAFLKKTVAFVKAHAENGDKRFMFNGLSDDKDLKAVFGGALSPIETLAMSQMTTSAAPFVTLLADQAREVFPKIGALVSDMNCGELLKSSVNKTMTSNAHTLVLGLCFESAPQGATKFRLMIMEEEQLRECLGEDDPTKYEARQDDYYPKYQRNHGGPKTRGCATPLPHQREDRLRVMRTMANLWFNSNGGVDVQMKSEDVGLKAFKLSRKDLKVALDDIIKDSPSTLPGYTEETLNAYISVSPSLTNEKKKELNPKVEGDIDDIDNIDIAEQQFDVSKEELPKLLKAFFYWRADKFYEYENESLQDFIAQNILRKMVDEENIKKWFPYLKKPKLNDDERKQWKYDHFLSRLVIIDNAGECHKLKELPNNELDWEALATWLETDVGGRKRFHGKWRKETKQGEKPNLVEDVVQHPIMARLTPMKKLEEKNRPLTNQDSDLRGMRGLTSVDVYGLTDQDREQLLS